MRNLRIATATTNVDAENLIPLISKIINIDFNRSPVKASTILPTANDVMAPMRIYFTNISAIELTVLEETPNKDNATTIAIKTYINFFILCSLIGPILQIQENIRFALILATIDCEHNVFAFKSSLGP
jgi:hypothetical protein